MTAHNPSPANPLLLRPVPVDSKWLQYTGSSVNLTIPEILADYMKKKDLFREMAEPLRGSREAVCPHFGECGGCMLQDVHYADQLKLKKRYLETVLPQSIVPESVEPSPREFGYRTRMDYVCAFEKRGLRARGRFRQVVDIEQCALLNARAAEAWPRLRQITAGLEDYNYLRHHGYLRYIVLRESHFAGQLMCNLVLSRNEEPPAEVCDALCEAADSVSLLVHDGMADLSFGPVLRDLKAGSIIESFDGIEYTIAPNSFFQSNSQVALTMYREIAASVKGRVLDLYSGVGSISLFCAPHAEHVLGVEIVEEAVNAAEQNRLRNNISNVEFLCADAGPFMREYAGSFDTLVLDPPRAGLHPKMFKYILEAAPERIVYMSCNPGQFAREIELFENYELVSFKAFDMFPQTPHLESLAVLERRSHRD